MSCYLPFWFALYAASGYASTSSLGACRPSNSNAEPASSLRLSAAQRSSYTDYGAEMRPFSSLSPFPEPASSTIRPRGASCTPAPGTRRRCCSLSSGTSYSRRELQRARPSLVFANANHRLVAESLELQTASAVSCFNSITYLHFFYQQQSCRDAENRAPQ